MTFLLFIRFLTDPANIVNLMGVNIVQFLGMQVMWILLMAVSSMDRRRKRRRRSAEWEVGGEAVEFTE